MGLSTYLRESLFTSELPRASEDERFGVELDLTAEENPRSKSKLQKYKVLLPLAPTRVRGYPVSIWLKQKHTHTHIYIYTYTLRKLW